MIRYALPDLETLGTRLLVARGVPEPRARRLARAQVEVHAFGVTTHGVPVLIHLVESLARDVKPGMRPRPVRAKGAAAALDCAGCLGVEALLDGRDLAEAKAREHGIGFVSLLRTGWVGVLGYHLAESARRGVLVAAWAQTHGGSAVVPFGGREGRLSTNPMAFAFPAEPWPVVADFSTSAVSFGKVNDWIRDGRRAPEPMFLDAQGRPTDDPRATKEGGAMLPFGGLVSGFRGTALSLWIEALTAATGGLSANPDRQGGHNLQVLALPIDTLADPSAYAETLGATLDYVRSSEPVDGAEGPRLPGHRGFAALEAAEAEGVAVRPHLVEHLAQLAAGLDVPMPRAMG